MKTGTVYQTSTVGTASGLMHNRREVGYVSARTYLGERTGEYIVSTPTTWGLALIVDNGPEGFAAYDDVDSMDAKCLFYGVATGREAVGRVLGLTSFRVDND